MNIVSVGAEVAPWSKTGGLGDVCAALPIALAKRGHRVMSVAPRYEPYPDAWDTGLRRDLDGHQIGFFHQQDQGVDRIFVEHPSLGRGGIYGDSQGSYADNWFRYSLLAQASLLASSLTEIHPGYNADKNPTFFLFHDWHASLLPAYLHMARRWGRFRHSGSALVIHNLAHQGVYGEDIFGKLMLPKDLYPTLRMDGRLNFLKGGMALADKIITVSPTYAKEICTPDFGMGLDGVLRMRRENLIGILNGLDTEAWNPQTDTKIAANFTATDLQGKQQCKLSLQKQLGLPIRSHVPLIAFVSRLDFQKGVDQIKQVLPWLVRQGAQVILMGTGDPNLENFLHEANKHRQVVGLVKFSTTLARQIIAGSDFLLMPSRFEPCGLTQQQALQYGSVPIVHATGGLRDTVTSFHPGKKQGNGWAFAPLRAKNFQQALRWALHTYKHHPKEFLQLQQRGMQADRSWDIAAKQYEQLMLGVLQR